MSLYKWKVAYDKSMAKSEDLDLLKALKNKLKICNTLNYSTRELDAHIPGYLYLGTEEIFNMSRLHGSRHRLGYEPTPTFRK